MFIPAKKQVKRNIGSLFQPSWFGMYNEALSPNDKESLINSYKSWTYVCSSRNAQSVARQKMRLYLAKQKKAKKLNYVQTRTISKKQKDYFFSSSTISTLPCVLKAEDIEEVTDHQFLDLTQKVNPFMNKFDLWETTQMYQELTGDAYWYVVNNNLGTPTEIWVLQAHKIRIIPDKERFIKGYLLYHHGQPQEVFNEDEIIHFKFPDPKNPYYGKSPVSAVASAYNINENINIYDNAIFSNMGRPVGGFETDQDIGDEDFERIKKELHASFGGVHNAGKTPFLDKGIHYKDYGFSPKELNHLQGRSAVMTEIAAAYGVPKTKILQDGKYSNSEVAEREYQQDTITPRLLRLEEKLNEKFLPRYDDNLFVAFDDPVPANRDFELKSRESRLKTNLTTIYEERLADGYEADKSLDVRFVGAGQYPWYVGETIEPKENESIDEKINNITENITKNVLKMLK